MLQVNPILHAWYVDQIKETEEKYKKRVFKLTDDIQSSFRSLETTELLLDSYKQFPRESKDSFILSLSLGEAELNIKKTFEVVENLNKNLLVIHEETEKFKTSWKEAVKIRVDQVESALKKPNEKINPAVEMQLDYKQNLTGMAALKNEVDMLKKVVHQLSEQVYKLTSQQHPNVQSAEAVSSIHLFSKK